MAGERWKEEMERKIAYGVQVRAAAFEEAAQWHDIVAKRLSAEGAVLLPSNPAQASAFHRASEHRLSADHFRALAAKGDKG